MELTQDVKERLAETTVFSDVEINKIYKRYKEIELPSGGLTKDQLSLIPEAANNPFIQAAGRLYSKDDGVVGPDEFVRILNMFSERMDPKYKRKFLFHMFDVDENNYIDYEDVFRFYKMMLSPAVSDERLTEITQFILSRSDLQQPGKLSFEDFTRLVSLKEVNRRMTLALQI